MSAAPSNANGNVAPPADGKEEADAKMDLNSAVLNLAKPFYDAVLLPDQVLQLTQKVMSLLPDEKSCSPETKQVCESIRRDVADLVGFSLRQEVKCSQFLSKGTAATQSFQQWADVMTKAGWSALNAKAPQTSLVLGAAEQNLVEMCATFPEEDLMSRITELTNRIRSLEYGGKAAVVSSHESLRQLDDAIIQAEDELVRQEDVLLNEESKMVAAENNLTRAQHDLALAQWYFGQLRARLQQLEGSQEYLQNEEKGVQNALEAFQAAQLQNLQRNVQECTARSQAELERINRQTAEAKQRIDDEKHAAVNRIQNLAQETEVVTHRYYHHWWLWHRESVVHEVRRRDNSAAINQVQQSLNMLNNLNPDADAEQASTRTRRNQELAMDEIKATYTLVTDVRRMDADQRRARIQERRREIEQTLRDLRSEEKDQQALIATGEAAVADQTRRCAAVRAHLEARRADIMRTITELRNTIVQKRAEKTRTREQLQALLQQYLNANNTSLAMVNACCELLDGLHQVLTLKAQTIRKSGKFTAIAPQLLSSFRAGRACLTISDAATEAKIDSEIQEQCTAGGPPLVKLWVQDYFGVEESKADVFVQKYVPLRRLVNATKEQLTQWTGDADLAEAILDSRQDAATHLQGILRKKQEAVFLQISYQQMCLALNPFAELLKRLNALAMQGQLRHNQNPQAAIAAAPNANGRQAGHGGGSGTGPRVEEMP